MQEELLSSREDDTLEIARQLGAVLARGDVVALSGDLGAGKTVFCKGIGEALGIPAHRIVSPTFTIVTEHEGRIPLFHVDVYRIGSEGEAACLGLEEYVGGEGVCVVEWSEKVVSFLPKNSIRVRFLFADGEKRRLIFSAEDSPRMEDFFHRCKRYLPGG